MVATYTAVKKAWGRAGDDLNLTITFRFILRQENRPYHYIVHIENFGSPLGALICALEQWREFGPVAQKHGYFCSGLNLSIYSKYNREKFIETLNDWGWFGKTEERPEWYSEISERSE